MDTSDRPRKSFLVRALLVASILAFAGGTWLWIETRPTAPEPVRYHVVRGDTLSKIAARFDVSVDELRAWNELDGDRIEVDQVLLVHPAGDRPPALETARKGSRNRSPTGPSRPVLRRPTPKPCLAMPDGDEALVATQGLSEDQIRATMNAFLPNALACVPEGWATAGAIDTAITVGCDGVVDRVTVVDAGGFPSEMVACVRDTLGYAPFPAHDQRDGMDFSFPVRFDF